MSRRLTVLLTGAAIGALMLAMAGAAWAGGGGNEPPPGGGGGGLALTREVPRDCATGVSATANVKTYFNHDLRKATVSATNFKIRLRGTTTWLSATRTVNNTISPTTANGGSESVATLNPNNPLREGRAYEVVVTTGVKDTGGDSLDATERWTFIVETDCLGCTPA